MGTPTKEQVAAAITEIREELQTLAGYRSRELNQALSPHTIELDEVVSYIARLEAELARKDEALRFYADGKHFIDSYHECSCCNGGERRDITLLDEGETAKEALAPAAQKVGE